MSASAMTIRSGALLGRQTEFDALDGLIRTTREGESGTIVVVGPAGIGKTSLLDLTEEHAAGFRIERAVGIESELELAYAGLHQLCQPMLDDLHRLPPPQHSALATALGSSTGPAPDRFLVGLAVLNLFSVVAEDRPLLAIVDDAQWLDEVSAQVLAFVARRIRAESVALLFAVRSGDSRRGFFDGLPELRLKGLDDADAHALLDSALLGPMDAAVRERVVADSRGCPLALLELSRGLSNAELAGGFGLPTTAPLISTLEEAYIARLTPLGDEAKRLLLVAALEPIGDAATVWRAAERLHVGRGALEVATSSGLIEVKARVRFRHPVVRSAILRMADARSTREAHGALAEATDPDHQPDRRIWHLAMAAEGPDEAIARELEDSAGRAQERGGLAAAAAFLKAAVALTPDLARRPSRAVAAAQAEYRAGASDEALALLADAEMGPIGQQDAARAELLRGQIASFSSTGRQAPPLLLAAAKRWQTLDPSVAREAYLEAISAGLIVGRFADEVGLLEVARAVRATPSVIESPSDELLTGFAILITDGYETGTSPLKRAVAAFRDDAMPVERSLRWLWLATHAARDLWDDDSWGVLATRHVRLARDLGALSVLPIALTARVGLHLAAGEITSAKLLVEEAAEVTSATGRTTPPYGRIGVAAWEGRETAFAEMTRSTDRAASARGDGLGMAITQYSAAVLYNSLGKYQRARVEADAGAAHPTDLCYSTWCLVELVEAATRTGDRAGASAAVGRLAETTRASGTDWGLGMEARSRALISEDSEAEALYIEAIARLERTSVRMELARSHLLYGEWQRRLGRRVDARANLRTAYEMFTGFGADALAERTRRELLATGETVRKRAAGGVNDLTAQEAQVAALAAAGHTNPEIGAELFISARTVEWHLAKVYPKLGITSRRDLPGALKIQQRSANRI